MTAAVGTRRFSDSRTLPGFEKELPKLEPRQAETVERGGDACRACCPLYKGKRLMEMLRRKHDLLLMRKKRSFRRKKKNPRVAGSKKHGNAESEGCDF